MTLLGWDGGLKGCFWARSDWERWGKSPQICRCSREAWHVWRCQVLCSFPGFDWQLSNKLQVMGESTLNLCKTFLVQSDVMVSLLAKLLTQMLMFSASIVFVPFTNLQIRILLSIISKVRPGWSSRWCEPLSRKQKVIIRLNGKHITHEPIFCWHLNKCSLFWSVLFLISQSSVSSLPPFVTSISTFISITQNCTTINSCMVP